MRMRLAVVDRAKLTVGAGRMGQRTGELLAKMDQNYAAKFGLSGWGA